MKLLKSTLWLLSTTVVSACFAEPTLTNSVGMEFIEVPAGTFMMGSAEGDSASSRNAKPQHQVTLTKSFYLAKYEVTQEQWEKVMGEASYDTDRNNGYGRYLNENFFSSENPVTVSWLDAKDFIAKLNTLENTDVYRLPSEAEWEYAARAGTTSTYFFGEDDKDLAQYAWYGLSFGSGSHHPVGQKQANPWGFYDVYGNVWEWVEDSYSRYDSTPASDPLITNGSEKVVRGGSWHITAGGWHSAMRKGYDEDYRGISIGFRVARSK